MERNFYIAGSAKEAILLKNNDSAFLAGGTEINRLNSGYETKSLISLKRIGLRTIKVEQDYLKIGACSTFQDVIDSKLTPSYLKKACLFMASRPKRDMATIGGNIACMRFDSYVIPTLVVAYAKLIMQNKAGLDFEVELTDYIEHRYDYSDTLILYVLIPNQDIIVRSKRCSNTALSHAFVTVSVSYANKKFNVFAGLRNSGFVSLNTLGVVLSKKNRLLLEDVLALVNTTYEIHFYDDIYGSSDYKKYILAASIYELYSDIKGGEQ